MKRAIGLSWLAAMLAGCVPGVVGSGHVVEQPRSVPAWTRLEVQNGMSVTMTVGAPAVLVRADDNLLQYVETYVTGDTLVVRHSPGVVLYEAHIDAVVSNDVLGGLEASGGSHVTAIATPTTDFPMTVSGGSHATLSGVSSHAMRLDASGGSHATVSGSAATLTLYDSGGSQVYGAGLSVTTADVDVSGGSHLELSVTTTLRGSASGGSQLTIYGRPSASVSMSGGSQITYVDN